GKKHLKRPSMKNLKAILLGCFFVSVAAVRAGIVVDDSPQDVPVPAPDSTPKPDDTAVGKSPAEDILLFANKDILHGTFLGCDKEGLHWQSPAAKAPLLFQIPALSSVALAARKQSQPATPAPTHNVLLTNGDELPGLLVSLD